MKRRLSSWFFIIIVFAFFITFLNTNEALSSSEKPIKLVFVGTFPAPHAMSIMCQMYGEDIEKETKGRVKITYYPIGTLVDVRKIYDAVVTGVADMGNSVMAFTPGRFPASAALDLPLGYPSAWVATRVANDFYDKYKPKEFDDVHVLSLFGIGPSVISMVSDRVEKIDDLKGKVIRGTGLASKIIVALGAQALGAPITQTYELLSKNVVQGTFNPREPLKGWRLAETVKYVVDCDALANTIGFFVVINKDKWNSFPNDIKKAFNKVNEKWKYKPGIIATAYDKVGIDYFMSLGGGREVIHPKDLDRWVDSVQVVIDKYIDENGPNGLNLLANEMVEFIKNRVSYWSGKQPSEEECVKYLNKILKK